MLNLLSHPATREQAARVAEALRAQVTDAERWKQEPAELVGLVRVAAERLPDPEKRALRDELVALLTSAGDPAVAAASPQLLPRLKLALLAVDPAGESLGVVWEAWLRAHDWRRLPPHDLAPLIGSLGAQRHPSLAAAQREVLAHLQSPEVLRRLALSDLAELAPVLGRIDAGFDPITLAAVGGGGVHLRRTAEVWLQQRPQWREAPLPELMALARALDAATYPALEPLQAQVLEPTLAALQAALAQGEDGSELFREVVAVAPALSPANRARVAQALGEASARSPRPIQSLRPEALLAVLHALTALQPGPAPVAPLVTAWAAAPTELVEPPGEAHASLWQVAVASDEAAGDALAPLQAATGGNGGLRAMLLLNQAYANPQRIAERRRELEERAGAAAGDEAAAWLLARAHLEELEPPSDPTEPADPLKGMRWVERAFAEAQGEATRTVALAWMVDRLLQVQEYERASALLRSVGHQFERPASREALARLTERVDDEREREASRQAHLARQVEIERLMQQAHYLQDQIDRARRQGSSAEDVRSLEQMLSNTRVELAELEG